MDVMLLHFSKSYTRVRMKFVYYKAVDSRNTTVFLKISSCYIEKFRNHKDFQLLSKFFLIFIEEGKHYNSKHTVDLKEQTMH